MKICLSFYMGKVGCGNMARLKCNDYGFDCQFIAEGKDVSQVIEKFGKHTLDEHGIDYSKEGLMQFIMRQ